MNAKQQLKGCTKYHITAVLTGALVSLRALHAETKTSNGYGIKTTYMDGDFTRRTKPILEIYVRPAPVLSTSKETGVWSQ
jgi:hypothetical protein